MKDKRCQEYESIVFLMICWSQISPHIPFGQKNAGIHICTKDQNEIILFYFLKDLNLLPEQQFILSVISVSYAYSSPSEHFLCLGLLLSTYSNFLQLLNYYLVYLIILVYTGYFLLFAAILLLACLRLLSRFSHVRLYVTPQTAAHQAPLSLGFSRQEHWSGLPFPSPMLVIYSI